MPKIFVGNTVTPSKKPLVNWGFTTVEGGKITYFRFPESESAYLRMEKELQNINNWGRYPGPHPEGRGSRNYTFLKILPDFNCIKVFSVFFPDGRVWDSHMRDFRRIRDIELNLSRNA
jgi:hypothetical protein